jgi:hypothetical protein
MTTETTPIVSAASPAVVKMPAKVAAAVVQVARGIKAVAKNGTNEHGKYMFASVDDFYDAVGPLMAEAGLFTFADMTRSEIFETETTDNYGKVKRNSYLGIAFDICLVHESGEMSMPVKREVTVISAGPQAYASAESFITKYFIRNLFKVPTGDYDADNDDKAAVPPAAPKAARPAATKQADTEQRQQSKPATETAKEQNIKTDPENRVDPANDNEPPAEAESKSAKLKPVLEFVATVNTFLDTKPDAAALFTYEGQPGINARMKRIRSDEFAHVPAVADLVKRLNAVYATAQDAEREVGQDG